MSDPLASRDQYTGRPPGGFDLKVAAGWVAEKISRLKLQSDTDGGIGTFEALETLALGILGKASLWRALAAIGDVDARVAGEDFSRLAALAEAQHVRVEANRLEMAHRIFERAA